MLTLVMALAFVLWSFGSIMWIVVSTVHKQPMGRSPIIICICWILLLLLTVIAVQLDKQIPQCV